MNRERDLDYGGTPLSVTFCEQRQDLPGEDRYLAINLILDHTNN